jgi:hypothetical protein
VGGRLNRSRLADTLAADAGVVASDLHSLRSMSSGLASAFFFAAAALLLDCGLADAGSARQTCRSVCARYSDCFDATYDSAACANRCDERMDADEAHQSRVDTCDVCMTDASCNAASFDCAFDCEDVVP